MLAAHLAVEAERNGDAPAWVIDTDRQATLTRWHERREPETPQRGDVRVERLAAGLATLSAQGAAYCFIDTAPTLSDQTATLIDLADIVLIPVRPSPSDLWSVTDTVQLVKETGNLFCSSSPRPSNKPSSPLRRSHPQAADATARHSGRVWGSGNRLIPSGPPSKRALRPDSARLRAILAKCAAPAQARRHGDRPPSGIGVNPVEGR